MAFSIKSLFRRPSPAPRPIATSTAYRTTDQLNKAIAHCGTLAELERFLKSAMMTSRLHGTEEDLSSCSGSAEAILRYLAFGRIKYGYERPEKDGRFSREPRSVNGRHYVPPGTMAQRLLSHQPPYVAVLEEESDAGSHVAILANTSGYWAFYQSNVGTGGVGGTPEGFSLSARVNALYGKGEKSRHRMDESGLRRFFHDLVAEGNENTLFYGSRNFHSWKIALYAMDGTQLNLAR